MMRCVIITAKEIGLNSEVAYSEGAWKLNNNRANGPLLRQLGA
jgi:hypothetical protein